MENSSEVSFSKTWSPASS